jgi:hypothetical protein
MASRMKLCCLTHRKVETIAGQLAVYRIEGRRKVFNYCCSQCGYQWAGGKDGRPIDERGWR